MDDAVARGVSRCPFLGLVRRDSGEEVAEHCASTAVEAVNAGKCPFHKGSNLRVLFESAHGTDAPFAFASSEDSGETSTGSPLPSIAEQCEVRGTGQRHDFLSPSPEPASSVPAFASISFGLPFMIDWFQSWRRQKSAKARKNRKQDQAPRKQSGSHGRSVSSQAASSAAAVPHNPAAFSIPGPLVLLGAVSKTGRLQCPPPIVYMRRVVADTPLCKMLRPQPTVFKLAACGVLSALGNVPPGMAKEHFEKFSPAWFIAIHISIPFVASIRKAVVLPKYALVITVAGAIGGQMIGGYLERSRLRHEAAQRHAIANGAVAAADVPPFCAAVHALMNPWDSVM